MIKAETYRKLNRCIGTVVAGLVIFVASQGLAYAHQDPAACNGNTLNANVSRDLSIITSGTTVHYRIDITNSSATGCNVTDTDIVFHCPAADGTPTGAQVTLTTTGVYPRDGSGDTCWTFDGSGGCQTNAGLACVVTLTTVPGQATARWDVGEIGDLTKGALHDSTNNSSFDASKELNVSVVECLEDADCPADTDLCTPQSCDLKTNSCVQGTPVTCNDQVLCTDDSCVPATGLCQFTFDSTNDPSCESDEFCRTPGFWGTHADADEDKACSQNITQAVLDAAGGFINVCGVTICNTLVDDEGSAVEAICKKVQGVATRQLIRQLTAARLNCIVSGEGAGACDGISINAVYDACNTACIAGDVDATVGADEINCIDAIDCFNNGGQFDNATGICSTGVCVVNGAGLNGAAIHCGPDNPCLLGECVPFENSCHDALFPDTFDLPNDLLSSTHDCFEKQGPAGSSDECKQAHKTKCALPDSPGECDTNLCD